MFVWITMSTLLNYYWDIYGIKSIITWTSEYIINFKMICSTLLTAQPAKNISASIASHLIAAIIFLDWGFATWTFLDLKNIKQYEW
jgi:hypothetical protein